MTPNDRFLLFKNIDDAKARSAEAATGLNRRHADHDTIGSYLWETIELTDGQGAVVIQPTGSGPFDESHTLDDGTTHGLTDQEVKKLNSYSDIEHLLPPPPTRP